MKRPPKPCSRCRQTSKEARELLDVIDRAAAELALADRLERAASVAGMDPRDPLLATISDLRHGAASSLANARDAALNLWRTA